MNLEIWKGELEVKAAEDKEEVILHAWFSVNGSLAIRVPDGFKLPKVEDIKTEHEYYKIERCNDEQK